MFQVRINRYRFGSARRLRQRLGHTNNLEKTEDRETEYDCSHPPSL